MEEFNEEMMPSFLPPRQRARASSSSLLTKVILITTFGWLCAIGGWLARGSQPWPAVGTPATSKWVNGLDRAAELQQKNMELANRLSHFNPDSPEDLDQITRQAQQLAQESRELLRDTTSR